jgi:hypothetical protein
MKTNATRHKLSLRKYQAPTWRVPLRRKQTVARTDPEVARVWRRTPVPDFSSGETPRELAGLLVDWVRRQVTKPKRGEGRWERRAA